jgi:hypothetical protein
LTAAGDLLQAQRSWPKLAGLWMRALAAAAAGLVLSATTTADVPALRISSPRVSSPSFSLPRVPSARVPLRPEPIPSPASPDSRIARLEKFFNVYHCPPPHHTSEYLRAADGFGLDYRLLPAVSIRETLCGLAAKPQNNFWGYHQENFPSIEAGINFLAYRLTEHPYYKGKSLQDKLFTYNPLPAYPEEVKRIMRQIE